MVVRRAISQETAATLTGMLVEVVDRGATEAQVPGYRIAGKTGTAQVPTPYGYHDTDTIASFVGFAPAEDPQFIVLVKLDKPRTSPWGSQTAAPTFAPLPRGCLSICRFHRTRSVWQSDREDHDNATRNAAVEAS